MKKIFLLMFAGLLVAACEKPVLGDVEDESEVPEMGGGRNQLKKFTFTVKGDFGAATFTRAAGYLNADGQDMTDLWVFDYVDGQCVQSVHQTATDEAWGKPQMSLAYGSHHVYFVASRGDEPAVDAEGHVIAWGTPRDTFWKDYEVDVVSTSNGNRAVTLDTVTAKDADGGVLGTATITGAPFKRNRSTEYSGSLFGSAGSMDVSLNVEWESPKMGTW